MKLYHYVHCPFCVRIRMAAGFLGIPYESIVLPYHDEKTPLTLTEVKMLPIAELNGIVSNESLDIIKILDKGNLLESELFNPEIDKLLSELGSNVHSLAMPYWIWTPEFDNESRIYFQNKKEKKRGPFRDLVKNRDKFIDALNTTLEVKLIENLSPYYKSSKITVLDISIAAHLWGMYIVPEYQFPAAIHQYLQSISKACNFNYHEDFWK